MRFIHKDNKPHNREFLLLFRHRFKAAIDDVRIYKKALTDTEVQKIAQ